jgi:4-hydroxy-tetrahydrodipicolinate reductase
MVAYGNYLRAFKAGVKLVSGSTGWMKEHGDEIKKLCDEGGQTLFWSSNFSLGVSIFSAVNRYLAKIMNSFADYDVSMTETHHVHKLDAPSGTAITLAEGILKELDRKESWVKEHAADATELPIHSIREGEVFGIHTIRYDSDVDSITITHDAKNRGGFALGAVLAAEYTATHSGFLGMADLFPFLND